MECAGLTLVEDDGAAVIAPKGACSPGKNPKIALFLGPQGCILLSNSGLQQVLEVFHYGGGDSVLKLKSGRKNCEFNSAAVYSFVIELQ